MKGGDEMRIDSNSYQTAFLKQLQTKIEEKLASNANNKNISVIDGKLTFQVKKEKTSEVNDADVNAKVQSLVEKFKSGKKLTAEEINFIRGQSPDTANYIERVLNERKIFEETFKNSPTKFHYYIAAMGFSKNIERNTSGEEKLVLSQHLRDAMFEFEKTDEFKEKPNTPYEASEKNSLEVLTLQHKYYLKKADYTTQLMINGYDSSKKNVTHLFDLLDKKL